MTLKTMQIQSIQDSNVGNLQQKVENTRFKIKNYTSK